MDFRARLTANANDFDSIVTDILAENAALKKMLNIDSVPAPSIDYAFIHDAVCEINELIFNKNMSEQQFHDVKQVCYKIAWNEVRKTK